MSTNLRPYQLELFPDKAVIDTSSTSRPETRQFKVQSEHRRKISRLYNLDLIHDLAYSEGYKPVIINAYRGLVPRVSVAFSKASATDVRGKLVHFYEYDHIIDRIWNNPRKYIGMLKRAAAVIGPDFSIAQRFPAAVNQWSLHKIQTISHYLQNNGVRLIPNIPVCQPEDYDTAFGYVEAGGIYAISNVQGHHNYFSRHYWFEFGRVLVDRLNPTGLVIYGNPMTISGVKNYFIENENIKIFRSLK